MAQPPSNPLFTALSTLAQATQATTVLLGESLPLPYPRIRSLCCLQQGTLVDNFSFLLENDPAAAVLAGAAPVLCAGIRQQYPHALWLRDFQAEDYVAQRLYFDGGRHPGLIVLLWSSPCPAAEDIPAALDEFMRRFSSETDALQREAERERARYASFVHDEFFREFVLDNPEAFHFAEYMPPVPLDLPEDELLERLMHTAHVTESNRAMAHLYGYPDVAAYLGATPYQTNGPERAPRMIKYWRDSGFSLRDIESQGVDADGEITWVRGSVVGHVSQGKLAYCWARRSDLTAQKRYEAAIQHKAQHDALTGLPNRYWLQEHLARLIKDHRERQKTFCIGLLDLNGFKEINDTLGHAVGDQILAAVAKRLLKGLKPHDAALARLGGDEFAMVLPEVADIARCENMAATVQKLLNQAFPVEDMQLSIGGALGLALFPGDSDNAEDLLRTADIAMYVAKREGQPFCWYRAELDHHSRRRLSLLTSLAPAIDNGELFLMYQPMIALRDGRLAGVEALIRWQHPTHGLIPPNDFIPFAETSEIIRPLTRWVLAEAIRQGALWRAEGLFVQLSVNVSVRNLLDEELGQFIADCLSKHAFPPEALELEVTESALMTRPAQAMHLLQSLRERGLKIAIDDFGTGYSSLAYLARLPVNTLKVDQAFVHGMLHSSTDAQIVRSIVGLAHECRLSVVAEGVEDRETLATLGAMGCDLAQGFQISHPMKVTEVTAWMRENTHLVRGR